MNTRYLVLNSLNEPKTVQEIRTSTGCHTSSIRESIKKLLKEKKISYAGRKYNNRRSAISYVSNKPHIIYNKCNECKEIKELEDFVGNMCIDCAVSNNYKIPDVDPRAYLVTPTIVNHMQNIINEQKQLIYKLAAELYKHKNKENE